jgi:hypothetical protein
MRIHDLKCWPEPFQAIRDRSKRFEFRKNDRDYQEGDVLRLREWDPFTESFTGRDELHEVTYLLTEGFGIPDGFCVMSIYPVDAF